MTTTAHIPYACTPAGRAAITAACGARPGPFLVYIVSGPGIPVGCWQADVEAGAVADSVAAAADAGLAVRVDDADGVRVVFE